MDAENPRFSTSEHLLGVALEHAAAALGAETKLIKLNDLKFRNCEGYYSKAAKACTWPCSITSMDQTDQLDQVYEMAVHWADILLIATPIRWGAASSLYYKMVERMNCIQNQITINNKVLIRNKVAAFIITGGQDGIQAVAGQMMGFFSEIGYLLPQFPFIAHSLGWEFEEMERNVDFVQASEALRAGARELVKRSAGHVEVRCSSARSPVRRSSAAGGKRPPKGAQRQPKGNADLAVRRRRQIDRITPCAVGAAPRNLADTPPIATALPVRALPGERPARLQQRDVALADATQLRRISARRAA